MITFSKLGAFGRLGNQLWQIASTAGIAITNDTCSNFPEWKYEDYFINKLPHNLLQGILIKEKNFHYDEYKLTNSNYDLHGYFQSYKYFEDWSSIIKEQFTFKPDFIEQTKAKFNHFDKRTIAIHVRRGDYVGNLSHYNLSMGYYLTALEELDWQNSNLLFFSDDIEFCKWHFNCLPNAYFSPCNEIEDLCLMTLCDDFIIANSSFSFWGAYLGEKSYSKVVRPINHFAGNQLKHDIKDLYPTNWIANDDNRPNIEDTTFIIPVSYDHDDRVDNLNLITKNIINNFETNINIIEQGGIKFVYTSDFAVYRNSKYSEFHRTKMINDCAKFITTPYIVNYDADILLNPVQIWYSVQLLRQGKDIVYPYDGTFNHINRSSIPYLSNNLYYLIGKQYPNAKESFGGAIFMNRESFLNAGGENEKFISFGPEDAERYHRFIKLGLGVVRIKGAIYHLDHYRGINSSKSNPFITANRIEWHKVRNMSKEELIEYIKTW